MLTSKSIGIIGARGIGKIYLRELIDLGIKRIFILGRSYKKSLQIKSQLDENIRFKVIVCKSLKEFKDKKLDLICICSPTNTHLKFINYFLKTKSKLLVEKPLFDISKLSSKKINKITNILFNKYSNKFITNLPLLNYTNSIKSKFNVNAKKINYVHFKYYTSGKNKYEDIAIDLLPHSLSFLLFFFNIKISDIKIKYRKNNKNS